MPVFMSLGAIVRIAGALPPQMEGAARRIETRSYGRQKLREEFDVRCFPVLRAGELKKRLFELRTDVTVSFFYRVLRCNLLRIDAIVEELLPALSAS